LPPAPPPAPPPPPPAPSVITRPDWLSRPDSGDLDRFYPERAKEDGVTGRATISCTVTARGTLTGCSVVSESPAGAGFGQATIRAASRFRMRPQTVDGKPVEGGTVRVPLVWNLGE
jgi:protein TonB